MSDSRLPEPRTPGEPRAPAPTDEPRRRPAHGRRSSFQPTQAVTSTTPAAASLAPVSTPLPVEVTADRAVATSAQGAPVLTATRVDADLPVLDPVDLATA